MMIFTVKKYLFYVALLYLLTACLSWFLRYMHALLNYIVKNSNKSCSMLMNKFELTILNF